MLKEKKILRDHKNNKSLEINSDHDLRGFGVLNLIFSYSIFFFWRILGIFFL